MAIRYIDEARKPRIRYLDEEPATTVQTDPATEPPFVADKAARAALVRPSSEWDRIARDASRPAEDRRRARDEEEFQAVQGMVLRGQQVNPDLVVKWQHKLQFPQGSTAKAASPPTLPTPAPSAPETLPVYQQEAELRADMELDPSRQSVPSSALSRIGGRGVAIKPAMQRPMLAVIEDAKSPIEHKLLAVHQILTADPETARANADYLASVRQFLTRYNEQVQQFGAQVAERNYAEEQAAFIRPLYLGLKNFAGGFSMGVTDLAFAPLERSMGGEVQAESIYDMAASGFGRMAGSILSGRTMAAGVGRTLAARTALGHTAQQLGKRLITGTASTLANNLTGLVAGRVKPEDFAGNVAQNIGASIIALGPEFGIPQGKLNFAGQILTDFAYDLATDISRGMLKPGENFTEWFLQTELPQLAASVVFATMDYTDADFERNRQRVKQDVLGRFRADRQKFESVGGGRGAPVRAGVDTREPVSPVRIDLPPAPAPVEVDAAPVPTRIQFPAAADTAVREAEVARQNAAAGIVRELPPPEPSPAPPAKPAEPAPQPAAPQRVEPAYPLSTAPAGAPHPFIDSQGRYVDAKRNVVVRDGEPVQAPPERPAVTPVETVDSRVEPADEPQPSPEESGWTPEIPGWTARVNSYLAGDRQISDVLDMAKTNPANAVWHLRNTARVKRIEGTPGFDTKTADRLEKLADRVETKLMNVGPSTAAGSRTPSADEPPPPPDKPASTPPPAPTKQTETPVGEGAQAPNKLTEARAGAEAAKVDEPVVAPPPKPVEQLKQKMKGKKAGARAKVGLEKPVVEPPVASKPQAVSDNDADAVAERLALVTSKAERSRILKERKDAFEIAVNQAERGKSLSKFDDLQREDATPGELSGDRIKLRPVKSKSAERIAETHTSDDPTRKILNGVFYDSENKAMVATDGRRLIMIPTKAVGGKSRIVAQRGLAGKTETDIVRAGQEIGGTFPNWKQVMPDYEKSGQKPIPLDIDDVRRKAVVAGALADKIGGRGDVARFVFKTKDGDIHLEPSFIREGVEAIAANGEKASLYYGESDAENSPVLLVGSKGTKVLIMPLGHGEKMKARTATVDLRGAMPPGPGLRGGPGAAAAEGEGEFAPRGEVQGREPEGGITSIRNRQTDMEREQLGLPKAEPIIRRAFPQVHDQVVRELDGDPTVGKRLIEDLRRNPRALTDREDCILLHEQVQAQAEYNRAAQATNKAAASGDKKAQAEAEARMGVALDTLFDVYQVGRQAGTESARGLNARKMFADENFDLVSLQLQKRASTGGDPLTRDQTAEVERIKAEYDKTKKALDELQSLYDEAKKANKPTITTEKKLRDAQKKHAGVVKKWQDGLRRSSQDPKRWADAIDEYLTERKTTVPADELNRIKGELRDASKLGDEQARDAAIARAINRFVSFVPLKTGDWFDAYIYTNMLSNPRSHARNTIGNLTNMMALRPLGLLVRGDVRGAKTYIKKAVGAVLDGSAWRRAMTSFGAGEPAKMVEVMADLPKSGSAIARLKRQMAIAKRGKGPENVLGRAAWKSLNWVGDFMQAQDQFVRQMIERGETARLVQRGETADYAEQRAKEIARQYLYHDKMGEPDKSLDQVTRTMEHIGLAIDHLRRIPGVPGRVFKMAAPFLKTPVKIAQFNAQTSFLGFIGANRNRIAKTRYGAKSFADIEARLQAERSKSKPDLELTGKLEEQIDDINQTSGERYGKAMVGTALTTLGSIWAANSNTAWEAPEDKKARQLFYDSGRRPYSFRVGNRWIPMMYLGPGMISFAIPAAIRHIAVDDPDSVDDAMVENAVKLMLAVPSMLIDQLPLEGVASLMNMVRGKDEYTWKRFVGRLGTQVVPVSGMMSFIKNMIDPTYRKVVTIEDTIKAGIPGLSEHVEAIKDSEGMDAKASVWDALWPYKIGKRDLAKEEALQDRLESMRERKRAKKLPASAPVALPPFTGVKFLTNDNTGSKRAP